MAGDPGKETDELDVLNFRARNRPDAAQVIRPAWNPRSRGGQSNRNARRSVTQSTGPPSSPGQGQGFAFPEEAPETIQPSITQGILRYTSATGGWCSSARR